MLKELYEEDLDIKEYEVDNKKLGFILNIKENTVRKIINENKIGKKLYEHGYMKIDKYKKSKKYIFKIKPINNNVCKIIKYLYYYDKNIKIKNIKSFIIFLILMYINFKIDIITISIICDTNRNTISRWIKLIRNNKKITNDIFKIFNNTFN